MSTRSVGTLSVTPSPTNASSASGSSASASAAPAKTESKQSVLDKMKEEVGQN